MTALKASNILNAKYSSIIFPTRGVEVSNKFLLAKLYQYLENFEGKLEV